ncbi:YfcC family protein [Peptoniphilus catoniae]|uniref:YfcC family protein n=1 Tax=Peptoniphilus catoniae TaxID=1660341 RepID=UPI0010FF627E|nr:YfcC family protein [Peptoniphilus catoniae]
MKKKKKSLSAFSILFIILIVIFVISLFLNGMTFDPVLPKGAEEPVSEVAKASFSDLIMSPYYGFVDAVDISIFVLVLGGFLGIVADTGALEAGIHRLVKNSKGKELMLITILMLLFSLGGTVYGMAEETVAFYGVITTAMIAAGFDSVVAVATICLGAGAGVLGSTVNPFAIGVAVDALKGIDITANQAIILPLGLILWLSTVAICIFFVRQYAKKVQADKGSTILSLQEVEDMEGFRIGEEGLKEFTSKHKAILYIFAFTFIVMIGSLIPWVDLGVNVFAGRTSFLTGADYGDWYFGEIAMWFLLMGIIIAIVAGMSEKEIVDSFVKGSSDILSVVLIIVVSRAVSVLMQSTHIDALILDRASKALQGTSAVIFVIGSYILYLFLSFLIPSTSGLAFVSIPVMGGLAHAIGLSPEVMIMIFSAGCGLINLITPTSGVVMGGLQMAKVNYSTWVKFVTKIMVVIAIANVVILSVAMLMFS